MIVDMNSLTLAIIASSENEILPIEGFMKAIKLLFAIVLEMDKNL